MSTLLKRQQIWFFFALTLIIGWLPWYTGRGSIFLPAPLLAAFIVAAVADGRSGVMVILRRTVRWRVHIGWYAFVLFIPAVIALAAVGIHVLFGGTPPEFPMFREDQFRVLLVFIFFLLPWQSSAFLEEIGFRGYALAQHQKRWGPLLGTLILGTFFGAWFLPEFTQEGTAQVAMGGLSFYPWFILTEIGWSVMMTWVYNRTGGSALLSGYLFHTAFNAWVLLLLTNVTLDSGGFDSFDTTLFIITALVVTAVALLFVIVTRGRLGYGVADATL
jgi:membrane protease YdiL (CAAX protease family)